MKTDRLINLWILLTNNPQGYTVKQLSVKFDVNMRTLYRDLVALGSELHVPVYNDKKRWKIAESYVLPPIRFTLSEALNIFLAARLMLRYSQHYDPNINATFTRLGALLPLALKEQVSKTMEWMQKLERNEKHLRMLSTVAEAWVSQRRVKITYRALEAGKTIERLIDPYFIEPAAPGHASYVVAYCHLKNAIRTFKIERMHSAEITSETYTVPTDFDANKFFGSSWGIVVEGEVKTIKLKIEDPAVMRIMEETIWHPSQVMDKQKDGSMIMTLKVTDTVDLFSWILGWGELVKVLEPADLRDKIIETAENVKKMYGKNKTVAKSVRGSC